MVSSKSSLDCLSLISMDDFRVVNEIPRIMKVPALISNLQEHEQQGERPKTMPGRRVIVSNHLPVRTYQEETARKRWRFELDKDSLALQLKDGFPPNTEVWYVGTIKCEAHQAMITNPKEQEEISLLLSRHFNCIPVFLSRDVYDRYYHGFCKHYLWPLFHYMLPVSPSHGSRFDRALWLAYLSANKAFADKVLEVISSDEDSVWVHDYHLMVLPTCLRKKYYRVRLGFFLHSPFPSSEIYKTIPVREEILKGLLNCDLVGFHTFDYARHFLTCCSRMLGLDYESKRGYILLDYYGRSVSIKILPAGVHMGQLETILGMEEMVKKVVELKERYQGKFVMIGVDDLDMFKGISLKFLAMGRLLVERKDFRGKVVLVQMTNPARSQGKDVQDVEKESKFIAEEINQKYRDVEEGYEPIVFINGPFSTAEKAAYYAVSDCCVVNAVRDGMNLVSYEYTVCRQGSPVLDRALGIVDGEKKKSVLIVSEFIGCSPSLSGAIRVNPWNIDAVADAMYDAKTMKEEEKQLRHEKHYKYISSHDVAYWARSFDQDLERACGEHYAKRYWGVGFGLGFRIVALGPSFRKLAWEPIVAAYKRTNSRLILLDFDGTTMPKASLDMAPRSNVISILNCLSNDPKNVVFIVSGREKDALSRWSSSCERLGIAAEHGYLTRWTRDSTWETCSDSVATVDNAWMTIAEPIMKLYTETTDGSSIELKESAMVWHHEEADPHFGSCQAKELVDHLDSVLANEPVAVTRGQHNVEVKPQGISKGLVVKNLITTMRSKGRSPDFLLCIGDDRSDEDMFEFIANQVDDASVPPIAEVFACTVGQKPSMAKYYLDDAGEIIHLLQGLALAAGGAKSGGYPVEKLSMSLDAIKLT